MSKKVEIKDSYVHGDTVLGDKYQNADIQLPLEKVIQEIKQNIKDDDPTLKEAIDELEEYITDRPDREIIGVKKKLTNGDRKDLIENAVYLKNKFEKKLAKVQLSPVEQRIYTHVLATIITTFNQKVRPLILDNRSKLEIDTVIQDEIIEPVYSAVATHDTRITTEHVSGMVYFLTGKCHVVWSEQC